MATPLPNPAGIVERLKRFQQTVRDTLIASRGSATLHEVSRTSAADTIYRIDAKIDPLLERFCEAWAAEEGPLVLVAEGLEDPAGREVHSRLFPASANESDARLRLIVDPIDGTRGIMYDKRSAWSLAGVAPNLGPGTRLQDIQIAVMTELPTSKMACSDVLSAVQGQGARANRIHLPTGQSASLPLFPSQAPTLEHGFASIVNFFPGSKILASELMEYIVQHLNVSSPASTALVFDDQYISTGGQFYELIVGHDRFNADLRPLFYQLQNRTGFSCHPYDCAAALIAAEAGVILTNEQGNALDGPLDTTTPISWIGYANAELRRRIEPLIQQFFREKARRR